MLSSTLLVCVVRHWSIDQFTIYHFLLQLFFRISSWIVLTKCKNGIFMLLRPMSGWPPAVGFIYLRSWREQSVSYVCRAEGSSRFHLFTELKGAVGFILANDKQVLAVEQNKVLMAPSFSKYLAWGFSDMSLRIGNYDSDKVGIPSAGGSVIMWFSSRLRFHFRFLQKKIY